jgi:hypothetical protein
LVRNVRAVGAEKARALATMKRSMTAHLHNPGENEQRFRANPNTLPVHSEQASG